MAGDNTWRASVDEDAGARERRLGLRSTRLRHHEIAAVAVFVSEFAQSFNDMPRLRF